MKELYSYLGLSKQSVSRSRNYYEQLQQDQQRSLALAEQARKSHPKMSCRDIWYMYRDQMPRGRDWTEQLMLDHGFGLSRPTRSYTKAGKDPLPNTIKGAIISAPNELWQTDITYIWAGNRWYFGSFLMDIHTRQILDWQLRSDLSAGPQVELVARALARLSPAERAGLTVHTDRGKQYTSHAFKKLLKQNKVTQSMAHYSWENAYIERFHRTLKHNYLNLGSYKNKEQLLKAIRKTVHLYNQEKPHQGLPDRLAPNEFLARLQAGQYESYQVNIWSELTHLPKHKIN